MVSVRKITVSVLGEQYHLVTDEHERDVLQAARSAEITLKMLHERAKGKEMSEQQISTLAILKLSLATVLQEKELCASQERMSALIALADQALMHVPSDTVEHVL